MLERYVYIIMLGFKRGRSKTIRCIYKLERFFSVDNAQLVTYSIAYVLSVT